MTLYMNESYHVQILQSGSEKSVAKELQIASVQQHPILIVLLTCVSTRLCGHSTVLKTACIRATTPLLT